MLRKSIARCITSQSVILKPFFGRMSSSSFNAEEETRGSFIPAYKVKEGETMDVKRARLLYQSRKRGMLENGLLLSTFASKHLKSMNDSELKDYDRLINLPSNDWDIYYWATGVKPLPAEFDTPIMQKFINHVKNTDRQERIRQPDLN